MKKISFIVLIMSFVVALNAQAPYRHSIGATLGERRVDAD